MGSLARGLAAGKICRSPPISWKAFFIRDALNQAAAKFGVDPNQLTSMMNRSCCRT